MKWLILLLEWLGILKKPTPPVPAQTPNPNSKLRQARDLFDQFHLQMDRPDLIRYIAKELDISKQVSNTYVSNLWRERYGTPYRRTKQ